MNPIVKAIDDIIAVIPMEVLQEVFTIKDFYFCNSPISMETIIRERVIDPRVLVDMDIMGGTETYIPLSHPVKVEFVDPYTAVYTIPDELTQNRPIRQIFSVHFGILGHSMAAGILGPNASAMASEMRKVLDSALRTPPASTSYINLINHNTFMVKYSYLPYSSAFVRCRLGNDDSLSFIRPQSIPLFAELCLLACKAYIYKTMRIRVDQAYLSGGQELGAFKDVIQEFSEAETEYREKLKIWKKVATVFNDPEARRRALRTIVGAV